MTLALLRAESVAPDDDPLPLPNSLQIRDIELMSSFFTTKT
jgi:hypothetical protein